MLDKKQIWAIFLFKFKMGCKAAETTCNINNTFGPGTANERTVQWWLKKFRKGDKSLKDKECNVHLSLYVFLLMTYYLLFILYLF